MTSADAIWLFLVALARHFIAPRLPPPSGPVGVLVVLTTPVKNGRLFTYIAIHSIVGA